MMKVIAALLTVLAMGLVACSPNGGPTPTSNLETATETAGTPADSTSPEASSPSTFGDYVGRSYDDVYDELRDYGVRITKVDEESTEPAGQIISQRPKGGSNFDTKIELTVAIRPAGVPDVLDLSFGEAKAALERLGFTVVEESKIDESKNDGDIISQDPAAGTENAGKVTLTVARQPVTYALSELQFLKSDAYISGYTFEIDGTFNANGKVYSRGSSVKFRDTEPAVLEFNLSRAFLSLEGELGLSDTSPEGAEAKVDIIGDGRELFSETIRFGETTPVKANVSDVLRLKIRIAPTDKNAEIILGDWHVRGFEAAVDEVTVEDEEDDE